MKKNIYTLTTAEFIKAFKKVERVERMEKKKGKLVGFLGGFPVYARNSVPPGEVWIENGETTVERFFLTDLDKPKKPWWKRLLSKLSPKQEGGKE